MGKKDHITNTKHTTKVAPKRRLLFVTIIFLTLFVSIAVFVLYFYKSEMFSQHKTNTTSEQTSPKEGAGGDPAVVTKYHDDALSAWKSGDKQKAKELAQKGLDANDQLTYKQQLEVPHQMSTVLEMNDIATGAYNEQ